MKEVFVEEWTKRLRQFIFDIQRGAKINLNEFVYDLIDAVTEEHCRAIGALNVVDKPKYAEGIILKYTVEAAQEVIRNWQGGGEAQSDE